VGTATGAAVVMTMGLGLGVLGVGGALIVCPAGAYMAQNIINHKAVAHAERAILAAVCERSVKRMRIEEVLCE